MSFWSLLKGKPTIPVDAEGVVAVAHEEEEEEVYVEMLPAMHLLHPLKILGISQP